MTWWRIIIVWPNKGDIRIWKKNPSWLDGLYSASDVKASSSVIKRAWVRSQVNSSVFEEIRMLFLKTNCLVTNSSRLRKQENKHFCTFENLMKTHIKLSWYYKFMWANKSAILNALLFAWVLSLKIIKQCVKTQSQFSKLLFSDRIFIIKQNSENKVFSQLHQFTWYLMRQSSY